ncbi:MAG: hypothetical protein WC804_09205 [Sphingomonas sp.]|jgi:hypothetical protein|uniref:hypothetical protein n=1 Tax=Sphingomonas sp. TaxID=28214 RepID=UPI003564074B
MSNSLKQADGRSGRVEGLPQWTTPHLTWDAIGDVTATVILAPGIDNYEASSPNDGS